MSADHRQRRSLGWRSETPYWLVQRLDLRLLTDPVAAMCNKSVDSQRLRVRLTKKGGGRKKMWPAAIRLAEIAPRTLHQN
jgi:hypothetical protein